MPSPEPFSTSIQDLTIDQAVQRALEHRPDLEALTFAIMAAKSGAKAAIAGYYPTLTVNSNLTQQTGESTFQFGAMFTANQLLWSFSGPLQQYKKAKRQAQLSALDRKVQSNVIQLQVEKSFLQAWALQENDRTILATIVSAKANYKKSSCDNKVKLLDKNIWLTNVENFASTMSINYQFDEDLESAFRTLEFLIGQPLILGKKVKSKDGKRKKTKLAHLTWHYPKKVTLLPLKTYYDFALTHRPEVAQGLKKSQIERENARILKGSRLPILSTNLFTGFQGEPNLESVLTPQKSFWGGGLALTWNLFDGAVTQYQENQSRANEVKELLNQQQTMLDVQQGVQSAYFVLHKSLIAAEAQKLSYIRARNDYILAKKNLEIGLTADFDFKAAQAKWEQEQLNWLSRNIDIAVNYRTLMFACGYPKELD